MTAYRLLTFDMGGTKTNAALFTGRKDAPFDLAFQQFPQSFRNDDYSGPEEMIAARLTSIRGPVDIVVLAIAGPVSTNSGQLTNRSWILDRSRLVKKFGFPHLFIINDLEALAYGIPFLQHDEIQNIQNRPLEKHATIAVIAPGTGLGEAFLTWSNGRYFAHPSEGGHGDFAPVDPIQIELLKFLMHEHGHVSYERLCSGPGLHNIYRFLRDQMGVNEPAWLSEKLTNEQDPPKTIVTAAKDPDRPSEICRQTINLFVSILGAKAGNLCLQTLPRGGVYIGGGIPPRLLPFFTSGPFIPSFTNKGRMNDLLTGFSVNIILNPRIPLWGAAYHGLNLAVKA